MADVLFKVVIIVLYDANARLLAVMKAINFSTIVPWILSLPDDAISSHYNFDICCRFSFIHIVILVFFYR